MVDRVSPHRTIDETCIREFQFGVCYIRASSANLFSLKSQGCFFHRAACAGYSVTKMTHARIL